jgi:hypothetical protein
MSQALATPGLSLPEFKRQLFDQLESAGVVSSLKVWRALAGRRFAAAPFN